VNHETRQLYSGQEFTAVQLPSAFMKRCHDSRFRGAVCTMNAAGVTASFEWQAKANAAGSLTDLK